MRSINEFVLTFLLNAAWQIALVGLAALVCARLLRGAPALNRSQSEKINRQWRITGEKDLKVYYKAGD